MLKKTLPLTHFADDKELLERFRNGDRDAFTFIYEEYHANLYTLAMRYLKNSYDADDILQQVFVKLWTIREALFVTTSLKDYLHAVVKHQVMNYIRNKNNAIQHNYRITQSQPLFDDELFTHAERLYLKEQLSLAIEKLPPQQRAVATRRSEGYSNQEIAKELKLSVNTVNTHYRECVKSLKQYLSHIVNFLILFFSI